MRAEQAFFFLNRVPILMCSFILSNLWHGLQLGGEGGIPAERRKYSWATFTFQPAHAVVGEGPGEPRGICGATLEVSSLCQSGLPSPNNSRSVGTLLLEGLRMTEALLLERRRVRWSDSHPASQQPRSPVLGGEGRREPTPGPGCASHTSAWCYKLIFKCYALSEQRCWMVWSWKSGCCIAMLF